MRVGAAVIPPLQAPVGAGSAPSNVRDQMTYPVSLSIKNNLFELPPTIEAGTKSVTPLAVTPCVKPWVPRRWLSTFDVHCNSKPGFDSASTEMFGSVCSQDVRCASAYGVGQSDQPRPTCANV